MAIYTELYFKMESRADVCKMQRAQPEHGSQYYKQYVVHMMYINVMLLWGGYQSLSVGVLGLVGEMKSMYLNNMKTLELLPQNNKHFQTGL